MLKYQYTRAEMRESNQYTRELARAIARQYRTEFIAAIEAHPGGAVFYIDQAGEDHVLTRQEFAALPIGPALDRIKALFYIGLSDNSYLFALRQPDRSTALVELCL